MPLFVVPPDLLLAGDPIISRIPGGFNVPPRRLAYGPPLAFGSELGRVLSAGARAFVSAGERSLSGAMKAAYFSSSLPLSIMDGIIARRAPAVNQQK